MSTTLKLGRSLLGLVLCVAIVFPTAAQRQRNNWQDRPPKNQPRQTEKEQRQAERQQRQQRQQERQQRRESANRPPENRARSETRPPAVREDRPPQSLPPGGRQAMPSEVERQARPGENDRRATQGENDRRPVPGENSARDFRSNVPPHSQHPMVDRLRQMSPQERERFFQNDERFHNLPPQQQAQIRQRSQNWDRMTPQQRQDMREREQVWQRMTPDQRQHVRNDVMPKWQQLPPDRRQAIQQRLRVLQNMPERARNQRLDDPNFTRGMSEEDKAMLRDLSHLHVGGPPDAPNE